MITDDKKNTEKPVTEPKAGEKIADVKPIFARKIDANTVVGDTKPAENLHSVPPQEKRV